MALGARRLRSLVALCITLSVAALAHAQTPVPDADDETPVAVNAPIRERLLLVPLTLGHVRVVQLHARLCLPKSAEPATLVLINHGSPPVSADRPKIKLGRCDQEAAQWFLSRGYAVAFVLRRGYGETGGDWAEREFSCARPDYVLDNATSEGATADLDGACCH